MNFRKAAREQHLGGNQPRRNICQRLYIIRISPAPQQFLRAGNRFDRKANPCHRTAVRGLSSRHRTNLNRLRVRLRRPDRHKPPRPLHLQTPTQSSLRTPKQLPPPQPATKRRAYRPQQFDRRQMGRRGAQWRLPLQGRPRIRGKISLFRGGIHDSRGRQAVLRLQASIVAVRGFRLECVGKAACV